MHWTSLTTSVVSINNVQTKAINVRMFSLLILFWAETVKRTAFIFKNLKCRRFWIHSFSQKPSRGFWYRDKLKRRVCLDINMWDCFVTSVCTRTSSMLQNHRLLNFISHLFVLETYSFSHFISEWSAVLLHTNTFNHTDFSPQPHRHLQGRPWGTLTLINQRLATHWLTCVIVTAFISEFSSFRCSTFWTLK